jgi:hypothetical protein
MSAVLHIRGDAPAYLGPPASAAADAVEQMRPFADLGNTDSNVRFAGFQRPGDAVRLVEQVLPLLRAARM